MRELCKNCVEWVDDVMDIEHCTQGFDYDVQQFLGGDVDSCPRFFNN